MPKKGGGETISLLLRVTQKGINRVLEFNIGLTAASFSSLCSDVPAQISSKQKSIYATQNPYGSAKSTGRKSNEPL